MFFFCSNHQSARTQLETWGPDEAAFRWKSLSYFEHFVLRSVWRVPSFRSAKFVGGPFGTKEMEVLAWNGKNITEIVRLYEYLMVKMGLDFARRLKWNLRVRSLKMNVKTFYTLLRKIMKLRLQAFLDSMSWSTMRTFILFLGGGSFFCSNKQTSWVSFSTPPHQKEKHIQQKRCWKIHPLCLAFDEGGALRATTGTASGECSEGFQGGDVPIATFPHQEIASLMKGSW